SVGGDLTPRNAALILGLEWISHERYPHFTVHLPSRFDYAATPRNIALILGLGGFMYRTIHEAAEAIRGGRVTPLDLVEQCLAAVERWEPHVHAWVFVDAEYARAEAK